MKEEYKVKFEMTTKKYEHDKTDRPTLVVHSYHNFEEDPEIPDWTKDAEAEFSLTDEKDKMYIIGTRDFYDCSTIILSKSEVKNLLRRLRKLERMMK
jgi:hypothetical protein